MNGTQRNVMLTHTSLAHPTPSPSALEMLIARDRLGHLSSSMFKCSRRDGSRRRSLGILWRETGGPRTGKRRGECAEGEKDWVRLVERDRQGKERVKG